MDIYYTLIPVYVLSKILGLAPFYLTYQEDSSKKKHRKFISSVGIIIVIRFIAVMGSMIYVAYQMDSLHLKYDLRGIALRCELLTGFVLTSTMLICAVLNRNLLIKIVEDIYSLDQVMQEANILLKYRNARIFSSFQITGITIVFLTKAVMQPFVAEAAFVSIYNIFNIVDYINTITLFQYIDLLLLLRQRYIWFNRKLRVLTRQTISASLANTKALKDFRNDQLILISQNTLLEEFNGLCRIHNNLYDILRKVNEAYSFRLLLTIGMRFIMITTQLLTTYKMIFSYSNEPTKPIAYLLIAIYLFLHTSKVFMIASVSSNTADKAKQTGKLLHNIWTCNSFMKENLNNFSLQILQQDTCFEAEGFFILDYALLYNITAALTVYLIILIQFDSASTDSSNLQNCTDMLNSSLIL